jgi:hypothetical protein
MSALTDNHVVPSFAAPVKVKESPMTFAERSTISAVGRLVRTIGERTLQ